MDMPELNETAVIGRYRLKKAIVVAVAFGLLVVAAAVAWGLCSLQLANDRQAIHNNQREMQEAWLGKALEGVSVWHDSLVEQLRLVSGAEMFRLFAMDVRALPTEEQRKLSARRDLTGDVEAMAEQMDYMRDLLREFVQERGWLSAQIVTPDGMPLLSSAAGRAEVPVALALVRKAIEAHGTAFGPVHPGEKGWVVDVVDPMYEVLGHGAKAPVAALQASIPVDKFLQSLLLLRQDSAAHEPCLLQQGPAGPEALLLQGESIAVRQVRGAWEGDALPFRRRAAFAGDGQAYSQGRPVGFGWSVVVETPAATVDDIVRRQAWRIYGLGLLGSLGAALLLAFVWASMVSRSHRATAIHFKQLYSVIRQQKLLLDSVNASLQAGLLLMDGAGRVQLCNPAFRQMAGIREEASEGVDIARLLPEAAAHTLTGGMRRVCSEGNEDSLEVSIPRDGEARLYRVTLFPFAEQQAGRGGTGQPCGGCVGIFQDITEFRRRAEAARQRQLSTMGALVRAIESVDANLVGHSRKMEQVAELLADTLNLDDKEKETLRLAARLSQVGKIFVPRELLTKKGRLTAEEQAEVRRAPEYAYGILRDMQFSLPVPEAVYQMGERMNGTGSPRQLQGAQIVQSARVLAVADAFCAMVSARSYRAGMPVEKAIDILRQDAGFDPQVVAALSSVPVDKLSAVAASGEQAAARAEAEAGAQKPAED